MQALEKVYPDNLDQSSDWKWSQFWSLHYNLQGYSFVAPSIIFGENEFTKRLVANKPNEHRPAPGAVDYAALFEVNVFLCPFEL